MVCPLAFTVTKVSICIYIVMSSLQSLCQVLDITSTRTSAYHPYCNGQVECFNYYKVEALLAKVIEKNHHDQAWGEVHVKVLK